MERLKRVLEFYDQQAEDAFSSGNKVQIIGGGKYDGSAGTIVSIKGTVVEIKLDNGKTVMVTQKEIKKA